MAKRYTDELAEWVKMREASRPRQDKSLVAFLAVKDDISEAIAAGYALKTIWEHLHEKGTIPYRYETFLKHVKKQIREKRERPALPVKPTESTAPAPVTAQKKTPTKATPAAEKPKGEGFKFNATPNKEELM